eukprot:13724189-Heterocapsa_arctica.AAC.1
MAKEEERATRTRRPLRGPRQFGSHVGHRDADVASAQLDAGAIALWAEGCFDAFCKLAPPS